MKAQAHKPSDNAVRTADRVLIGKCPGCRRVLVVLNAHETWPWVECVCEWQGSTTDFAHVRYERLPAPSDPS